MVTNVGRETEMTGLSQGSAQGSGKAEQRSRGSALPSLHRRNGLGNIEGSSITEYVIDTGPSTGICIVGGGGGGGEGHPLTTGR